MRFVKIPLICGMLMIIMTGVSLAQGSNEYLHCNEITPSFVDDFEAVDVMGKPGDTLWLPFRYKTYERMSGLFAQYKYDPTYLTPLVDTIVFNPTAPPEYQYDTFFVNQLGPNLEALQNQATANEGKPTDVFYIRNSYNEFDDGAFQAWFSYTPGATVEGYNPVLTLEPGEGIMYYQAFLIDSLMPDGVTAEFLFHDTNECVIVGAEYYCANCKRTQFVAYIFSGLDTLGESTFASPPIWPTLYDGTFTANSSPPPVIETFYADPDTVNSGNNAALNWTVSNADSVRIFGPTTDAVFTQLDYFVFVTPPSAVGTYTYTCRAYNEFDSTDATTNVVVTTGGVTPDNHPPIISVTSNFTVEQGQALSFQVTATDADNDEITLSANPPLPNNASFAAAIAIGSVSGTFSWTPDINQEGYFTIVFAANDGKATTTSAVTIEVTGITQDRLFSTSATGQAPVGGLPGREEVFFPIDLVTAQTVYGVQFEFIYDYLLFDVDSFVVTGRTPDYVVYDNIGQTPGQIKVVTFGLANEPVVVDTSTAVLYAAITIDSAATWGDYPISFEDGWESINPDPNFPSLELALNSGIIQVDRPGDINLDKRIDVADLVSIVAYIIGNYDLTQRRFEVADVIRNDTVNVFDLVGVINLIYGIPLSPVQGQPVVGEMATVELQYDDILAGTSDELVVSSELPVDIAAVQLEVRYDPIDVIVGQPVVGESADNLTLRFSDNGMGRLIVLMHFKNPFSEEDLVHAGTAELVNIPVIAKTYLESGNEEQIKLTRVLLSTSEAASVGVEGFDQPLPQTFLLRQNYPNPFNPITTIEFSLGISADGGSKQRVNLDIYNILGRHVKSLVDGDMLPGNYQVQWDATNVSSQKVATGIYLYRLKVGSETKTKKMLLLK